MSNAQSEAIVGPDAEPFAIHSGAYPTGVYVGVHAAHGPDWFPLEVRAGLWSSTLYLKRAQLRALRDRLDEIDRAMPEPEPRVRGARS